MLVVEARDATDFKLPAGSWTFEKSGRTLVALDTPLQGIQKGEFNPISSAPLSLQKINEKSIAMSSGEARINFMRGLNIKNKIYF